MKKKIFGLFALILICSSIIMIGCSSGSANPWEGMYFSGGSVFIKVNKDTVQVGDNTNSALSYKYSDGALVLSSGVKLRIAENNRVLYYESLLGYKFGTSVGQSRISVRDGYFNETLITYNSNNKFFSYNFDADGTYVYIDDTIAIPTREVGTYTLNDGVLIMQSGSKLNFWYIDSNYDIYVSAFIKDYAEFNSPSEVDPTQLSYDLLYSAGAGGMITGATIQSVKYGENGSTVYVIADIGYKFIGWSDGYMEATRTDLNITDSLSVTANFEAKKEYTVTYIAGENGSVQYQDKIVQTVYEGDSYSVFALPNDANYYFYCWSDGVTTANRTDSNITDDITVTAYFKLITYQITYSVTEGGYIDGETVQTVRINGNSSAVTTVAYYGYKFVGWSDGLADKTRAEYVVYQDVSLTAIFEKVYWAEDDYAHRAEEHVILQVGDECQICGLECHEIKNNGNCILMKRNRTAQDPTQYVAEYYGENSDNIFNAYSDKISIIYLSAEVKTIAANAFSGYSVQIVKLDEKSQLTSIRNYAFENCRRLTSIEIPNGVTSIGDEAFRDCSSLTSIKIPNGVTSIGGEAFKNCSSLTSIEVPNSVTSIDNGAFENCSSLTSIKIANGVTCIARDAFRNCRSLTSVKIPNSVTSIGDNAFSWCSSLKSIEIPNSVTSIGSGAFNSCNSLKSVEIPSSVTSIGSAAFGGCNSLIYNEYDRGLYLGNLNNPYLVLIKAIDEFISECIINDNTKIIYAGAFRCCSKLTAIVISNGVTSIGVDAFIRCGSLTSVEIPNSVTSIGDYAFYECSSLTGIEIPNSVTSIGDYAFDNCRRLTSIKIPNSVTSIGDYAFYGCSALETVYYCGGKTEWSQIERGSYIANYGTLYFYSEEAPTESGKYWHYDEDGKTPLIWGK